MNKSNYLTDIKLRSWSDNGMLGIKMGSRCDNDILGTKNTEGEYNLPYLMKHMLEVEEWVSIFHPQPLYNEVKSQIVDVNTSNVNEGDTYACEHCEEIKECGFDYEPYFEQEEYSRILAKSRACSLECAIKFIYRGDYAPSVSEFKRNPDAYKTLGYVG